MNESGPADDVVDFRLELPGQPLQSHIRVGRGLLAELPRLLESNASAHRYALISDDTVAELYAERLTTALRDTGAAVDLLRVPPGEASKTAKRWSGLVEALAERGFGRDGCVVAVGGGVVGDLAGFVAASYARGVPFVQVPTTLLAMIDASIGGKTGLDLRAGKNLVGAFHQPRLVVIDPAALDSLPLDELRTGLAEAVKHGAIADADYFAWLEGSADRVLDRDPVVLQRLVVGSVRIKTAVVVRDALEAGERAILNFGHTVAHAVERVTDFAVPHGRAVGMGMVLESRIGEAAGRTEAGTADRLARLLAALGLPTRLPDGVSARAVLDAARLDKKARTGAARYALIARIGEAARTADGRWTHAVPDTVAGAAMGTSEPSF